MRQITYKTFKNDYLDYCRREKRHGSYLREKASLDAFDKFLPTPIALLAQVTPSVLSEVKNRMRFAGKGSHGINRNIRGVKTAIRWAEIRYGMPRQDWSCIKQLPVIENRELFYSAEELKRLLALSTGPFKTAILLGSRCGLRPAEIEHSVMANVDFNRKLLHVGPVPCSCSEFCDVWHPKNRQSDRWIPLEPGVFGHIQSLPRVQTWLLGDPRPSRTVFRIALTRIMRQAGLKGSLYTLRHTFASHLVMAGVPLKKVSILMGHKSQSMTEKYAHLAPDHMQDETSKLPALLFSGLTVSCISS